MGQGQAYAAFYGTGNGSGQILIINFNIFFRGISGATGVPVVACALGPTLQLTADSVIPAEAMPYNEEHLGTVL